MKPSDALISHRDEVRAIIARHPVRNPRVFGSVLYGHDTEGSDLDLLVEPTGATTLAVIGLLNIELSELLGVKVEVLTPNALPASFRDAVLAEAKPV